MERGLGSQDTQRSLGPLELTVAKQGESDGGGLLMVERHLPGQPGKVHCREESGLFFLDVGQRLLGFFEFDGFLLTLFVEESKILNHSVPICVLETKQRCVKHVVGLTN